MTPEQRRMARHALGLGDFREVSYRNRYYADPTTTRGIAWEDLVRQGFAERTDGGGMLACYFLTAAGAKSVLEPGERLCPEDFPSAVSAPSNHPTNQGE